MKWNKKSKLSKLLLLLFFYKKPIINGVKNLEIFVYETKTKNFETKK